MRINKLLSNYGICSRTDANRLIDQKRIMVNGELCITGQWVEVEDNILIDNETITVKDKIYIALNKPIGITCTAAKTVQNNIIDFINYPEYIFPVGRLDKNSQGLIFMTNDGNWANSILESKNEHEKEYIVTIDKPYDEIFIKEMSKGVKICNVSTRECKVSAVSANVFAITLTQGLNKQIRRMCRSFGYTVVKLERIRIIDIKIEGINIGKWRFLTGEEVIGLSSR